MKSVDRGRAIFGGVLVVLVIGALWPTMVGATFMARAVEKASVSEAELMWFGLALEGAVPLVLGLTTLGCCLIAFRQRGRSAAIFALVATASLAVWIWIYPPYRLY